MNGTIIDIPGISVNVTPHYLEHSTDTSYTITVRDERGNTVLIQIVYGKIVSVTEDILR